MATTNKQSSTSRTTPAAPKTPTAPDTDEKDVQNRDTEKVNGEDTKVGEKSVGAPKNDADGAVTGTQTTEGATTPNPADVPGEAASGIANGNSGAWAADGLGNPMVAAMPARPIVPGRQFYAFDFEDGPNGTLMAKEDVYMVVNYPGSTRVGRSLAYAAGTILNVSILDAVREEVDQPDN